MGSSCGWLLFYAALHLRERASSGKSHFGCSLRADPRRVHLLAYAMAYSLGSHADSDTFGSGDRPALRVLTVGYEILPSLAAICISLVAKSAVPPGCGKVR